MFEEPEVIKAKILKWVSPPFEPEIELFGVNVKLHGMVCGGTKKGGKKKGGKGK